MRCGHIFGSVGGSFDHRGRPCVWRHIYLGNLAIRTLVPPHTSHTFKSSRNTTFRRSYIRILGRPYRFLGNQAHGARIGRHARDGIFAFGYTGYGGRRANGEDNSYFGSISRTYRRSWSSPEAERRASLLSSATGQRRTAHRFTRVGRYAYSLSPGDRVDHSRSTNTT